MPTPGLRWVFQHPRVCAALLLLALVALIVRGEWPSSHEANQPRITLLPADYTIPPQKVPLPDRWIPRSWGWLWRLKEAVLGKAKVVSLNVAACEMDSVVLGMQAQADPDLGGLLSHPDFTSTNGLRIWLLPNQRIRELQKRFPGSAGSRSSFRAGITTADKCQASLATTGLNTDGLHTTQVDVLPLFRSGTTELTFILRSLTPVPVPLTSTNLAMASQSKVLPWPASQTNVLAAVRLQLPSSTGFLLLDSRRSSAEIESAVLVTVEPPASNPVGTRAATVVKRVK